MSEQQNLLYETPGAGLTGIGVGTISLQLIGLYFIVMALSFLPWIPLLSMKSGYSRFDLLAGSAQAGVLSLVGLVIIWLAPRLSIWIFRGSTKEFMAGRIKAPLGSNIQAIAFSVIGVYLVIEAMPTLTVAVLQRFFSGGPADAPVSVHILAEELCRLVLGIGLFLDSRRLSRLWHRLRDPAPPIASIHSGEDRA